MADGMTLTHRPLPSFCHAPITHTKYMRAAGVPLWSFWCGFASDRSVLYSQLERSINRMDDDTRRNVVDVVQPSNLKVFCVLVLCIYFSSDIIKESANLAFICSAVCRTNQIAHRHLLGLFDDRESRRAGIWSGKIFRDVRKSLELFTFIPEAMRFMTHLCHAMWAFV